MQCRLSRCPFHSTETADFRCTCRQSHSRIAVCGVWRTGRRRNRCGGEGCTSRRSCSSLSRMRRRSQHPVGGTACRRTTRVPTRRHFLHQSPQVQCVSVVAYDLSTRFSPSYLGDARLVVSVEYDGRTTDDVIFDEFVHVALVRFKTVK